MEYYYNGKMIARSENGNYTHAVIHANSNTCLHLAPSAASAKAYIDLELELKDIDIANQVRAIEALKAGKDSYDHQYGDYSFGCVEFRATETVEDFQYELENGRFFRQFICDSWKVVEVEANAEC